MEWIPACAGMTFLDCQAMTVFFVGDYYMKKLLILNMIIGLVLVVAFFFSQLSPRFLLILTSFLIVFLFCGLIFVLVNFISIFKMWHKYKYLSFIPFAISLLFFYLLGLYGHIVYKPIEPNSYFDEERKQKLTEIAEQLLLAQDEIHKRVIEKKLKSHNLEVLNIDRDTNVVEFGCYRIRTWYYYIFAKDELPEIYSSKPIITESDILYWGELVTIIKTENDLSKYRRDETSFMTEIVYPFLVENLDKEFVDKLAGLPSIENLDDFLAKNNDLPIMIALDKRNSEHENLVTSKLTTEERLKVIEVLNRHCQILSKLMENKNIRWLDSTLVFCDYMNISSSFQVNRHLRQLISDGVISIIDEEGHLQMKQNLSDKEKREIEWLQVEIMNFVYGNLIEKTEYWSNGKTRLTNNWYFCSN